MATTAAPREFKYGLYGIIGRYDRRERRALIAELAAKLGVSPSRIDTYRYVKQGDKSAMTTDQAKKIAEFFDVPLTEIVQ